MSEGNITTVNTKLKAYKLIHDPTVLLNLIYSKYGDIDEDYELLNINQLVYDKSSHYNIFFKEFQFFNSDEEYLKRFYKKVESKPRIPKLSEYYKNYHVFFCRPRFKDLIISDLIQSYEDDRAEIFYKKNFEDSNSKDEDKTEKHDSNSLSSLDNITDNKIIFTKKTKKIIDNDLNSDCVTLTLTTNSINLVNNDKNINNDIKVNDNNIINNNINNDGLISSRDVNDSFEKIVHNLIYFKKNKKKPEKNKNKNNIKKKEKTRNREEGTYLSNKNNKNNNNSSQNNNSINLNNIIRKTTPNINNKMSLFALLKQTNTINYSKQNKKTQNKIKNNINKDVFSPKENIYFSSKLEEFHNNVVKQTNSSHHQRNKTYNFNQNQTTGMNNKKHDFSKNINININNNISRNELNSLKNFKQNTQFNNFLTVNNNVLNNKKASHNKNKTFDNSPNVNNNLVKNMPTVKDSINMFQKTHMAHANDNIKRNNFVKSKFNLVKSPLAINFNTNKINLNKKIENNNFKYYKTKFSPSNCLYRNLLNGYNNMLNLHKKTQTTYLSTMFEGSPQNKVTSPMINSKQQKKYYNINKSDNITSKIKPKIAKGRINNLNINFNNVIFNAPLSNINENINFNSHIINNNSNSFNLVPGSTNNNGRNNFNNNTFSNNNYLNNSSHTNNNLSEGENQTDKNLYIMNLKNVYNISRNKVNIYGGSFSQTDNFSLSKNNGRITYDNNRNKIINNTYSNIGSNDKKDILKGKKSRILIKKSNNKSGNQNQEIKSKNSIKKSIKNLKMSNKRNEANEHLEKNKDNSFRNKEKNDKIENNFKNGFISPNTTGRNIAIQPINVNRNSNLLSKKITKSNKKIK